MKRSARGDALVDRWSSDAGQALVVEVFRRLRDHRPLDGLPLGTIDGRVDLRGIAVSPGEQGIPPDLRLDRTAIEGLDFSGAMLRGWRWTGTTVRNCRFDDADCRDLTTWDARVEEATFTSADLRGSGIGGSGCVFRRVDFSRANFRGAYGAIGEFIDCDFSNAKFPHLDWCVTLVRCRFAGTLRDMRFHDRTVFSPIERDCVLEDVDFSAADLRWIEFYNFDLARVRLPEDAKHLVIRGDVRRVYERSCEVIDESPSAGLGGLQAVLQKRLRRLHPNCRVALFNLQDLAEHDGETGTRAALLRRVAAEVGATTNL